jgi:uncharacterized protein YegP (UPF0339 family)
MTDKIEIFKGEGLLKRWYVRLRASNGQVLSVSEGYVSLWNARRAARRLSDKWDGVPIVDTTLKPVKPYRRFP